MRRLVHDGAGGRLKSRKSLTFPYSKTLSEMFTCNAVRQSRRGSHSSHSHPRNPRHSGELHPDLSTLESEVSTLESEHARAEVRKTPHVRAWTRTHIHGRARNDAQRPPLSVRSLLPLPVRCNKAETQHVIPSSLSPSVVTRLRRNTRSPPPSPRPLLQG
eukprot:1192417-Prorocentrum_minimum.AAC.2